MPLKPLRIHEILKAKRDDFTAFDKKTLGYLQKYRAALGDLAQEPPNAFQPVDDPEDYGAFPLEPLTKADHGVIAANLSWTSRAQSLDWVRDRLTGIHTFAVDGSQIYPGKDLSIPVALVQIGWFENPHLPSGDYEKDIDLDVMTPGDLAVSSSGEPADRRVNFRRFEMEVQRLIQYIKAHGDRQDCLVFFDGSLVGTFARMFDSALQKEYVDCFVALLQASQSCRVPLVGYVDTTYARDLTVMLQHQYDLPPCRAIHDAQLLHKYMSWGDRSALMQCLRSGILQAYGDQHNQVAFTYLKTTREGYPARLEMPLWVHEAGLTNRILDWVRGEVIIGGGYPYVLETADQTAVLQAEDRQAFFRILQEWTEEEHLNLRFSRKMVSKTRRR